MIIIGITGTLCAGKGTIVDCLKSKGFKHLSMSEFITREIRRRGLPVNRDTMVEVANDLRAKNSPSYIAETLFDEGAAARENCVIESLRTPGEIHALQKRGDFYLFAVDANPATRFLRSSQRKTVKDDVSLEKFLADEKREMQSVDPNKQNLSACIAEADYLFMNDGTREQLWALVESVVRSILTRQ
jgi:dephospho-CoA kinase